MTIFTTTSYPLGALITDIDLGKIGGLRGSRRGLGEQGERQSQRCERRARPYGFPT